MNDPDDDDGKDEDWRDPSSAQDRGQSKLKFTAAAVLSTARSAKKLIGPRVLSRSQVFRRRQATRARDQTSLALGMANFLRTHREATARADAVVEARGVENTADEKRAAEAIALAAAQECRTWSVRQSSRVFKKWARKEAEKKAEKDMPVITGV